MSSGDTQQRRRKEKREPDVSAEGKFTPSNRQSVVERRTSVLEALEIADESLATEDLEDSATLLREAALAKVSAQQFNKALALLDRVLSLRPEDVIALTVKGYVLGILGRHKDSLRTLDQALTSEAKNVYALVIKGGVLRVLERYEEALRALDEALTLEPENAFALGTKGQVLRALGRYEEAAAELGRAMELEPRTAWICAELGDVLRVLGRYEEALRVLDEALTLEPDNTLALAIKGKILSSAAYYRPAIQVFDQAERLGLHEGWILAERGWALQRLGVDYARDALRTYQDALRLEPNNTPLLQACGDALYLLGDWEGAAEEYQAAIEQAITLVEKPDVDTLALIGWCNFRLGQYDEAEQRFRDVVSLDRTAIETQFDLALVLLCTDRQEFSHREYNLAVESSREKELLYRRGLLDVALDDLNQAMKNLNIVKEAQEALNLLTQEYNEIKDSTPRTL
jgi:tetratricopeptide (TPR) repeat protein